MEEKDNPEVVADNLYDHAYDSVGYGLIYYHSVKSKKKEIPGKVETLKKQAIKKKAGNKVL